MSYPTDVKVGDTVYVWGGTGFTKPASVVELTDYGGRRGVVTASSKPFVLYEGEWFYSPVTFPIPERPKRKTRVELHGMARRPS